MAEAKRATLKDVAAASGVSRATVSFVLNDTPNQSISQATRARILAVVKDLGYKPHGIARALREGTSRIVVLYIGAGLDGNYSRSYIRGLDEELAGHDHVLVVRRRPADGGVEQQVLDAINPRAVVRFAEPYRSGHELEDGGGGQRDGLSAHVTLQIGYLAARGHTRIALALPDADAPLREIRERFSRQATEALGLPAPVSVVVPRPRQAGTDAVAEFRDRHPAVTAIAGYDDDAALRALTALLDLGLDVPGTCAVIGFDDIEYGALFTPALTTVHIDAEAHGRLAARSALGLSSGDLELLPARVLERQTV